MGMRVDLGPLAQRNAWVEAHAAFAALGEEGYEGLSALVGPAGQQAKLDSE